MQGSGDNVGANGVQNIIYSMTSSMNNGAGMLKLAPDQLPSPEKLKRTADQANLALPVECTLDTDSDDDDSDMQKMYQKPGLKPGKKTKGRVKIKMEFIENKLRRYTTFSKRKTGIMKKAYELSTLTGTQVMLLVASETGHVYTFATRKLQPMITSESGKALIQTCLNSPDPPPGQHMSESQRMNPSGFEEPDLTYPATAEEEALKLDQQQQMISQVPTPRTYTLANVPGSGDQNNAAQNIHISSAGLNQGISMTSYMAPVSTQTTTQVQQSQAVAPNKLSTPSPQATTPTMAVQLPGGSYAAILSPSAVTGMPPGTPIAIPMSQLTQNAQLSTSQAGQIFRLPPANQNLIEYSASSSTGSINASSGSTITTAAQTTQSATIPERSNRTQANNSSGGTVMYQTPQGVVYATPTTQVNHIPDTFILNLPSAPVISQQPTNTETTNSGSSQQQQPQFISIPIPVSIGTGPGLPGVVQSPVLASQTSRDGGGSMEVRSPNKLRK